MEEMLKYMKAQVLLQLHSALVANGEEAAFRPEILLSDAGFAHREIAAMLGKSQMAVSKAISRARSAKQKANSELSADDVPADSSVG